MSAPSEFLKIGLDPSKFKKAAANEYHGPCPTCGGDDRFRVHTARPFPHWYMVCREGTGCNFKGWADEFNESLKSPDWKSKREGWEAEWAQKQAREEQERKARLAEFTTAELWAELHRRMSDENRAWWRAQGIPDSWQDYFQLGYTPDKPYMAGDSLLHSPAYTIPYFHYTNNGPNFVSMQYRLCNPARPDDRYRFEKGMSASYYHPVFTVEPGQKIVICEGAKKGMVMAIILPDDYTVLAVPNKSGKQAFEELFRATDATTETAYVMLDPDALTIDAKPGSKPARDARPPAHELAAMYGKRGRVVYCPIKPDDMVTQYRAVAKHFESMFEQSRKVA